MRLVPILSLCPSRLRTQTKGLGSWVTALILTCGSLWQPAQAAPALNDAIRFLEQSSFGPTPASIAQVRKAGIKAYLNKQFDAPQSPPPELSPWPDQVPTDCDSVCRREHYSIYPLQRRFFKNALTAEDQLRQRVAFALNQIFVVSALDGNLRQPDRMWPYLEILERQAFGSFRELIKEITLNAAMGRYLDMVGNRANAPNENYARELLQLFTIGVNKLNIDGTEKRDAKSNPIPSYSQETVETFARVFTGWVFAPTFSDGVTNYRDPMVIGNPKNHDVGEKKLLNDYVLAAGGTALDDLESALDNIVAHPNVAPFISKQLIQHLVTSNPPRAYVGRVAQVFKRSSGNMKAVIRAILLDPEARNSTPSRRFGHLREPVLWITQLLRAFDTNETSTDFILGEAYLPTNLRMGQDVYRSPSVFNFFPPDYIAPNGTLLGPEFAIASTQAAFARANFAYETIFHKMPISTDRPKGSWLEFSAWTPHAADPVKLVKGLHRLMLHGNMKPAMLEGITAAVAAIPETDPVARVREAVYLIAVSPQYLIAR